MPTDFAPQANNRAFQDPRPAAVVLGYGALSSSYSTLYTAPNRTNTQVTFGHFQNTGAGSETVEIQIVPPSDTARFLGRAVLAQNEQLRLLDDAESVVILSGWSIQARTTTYGAVDYTITGIELFVP